MAENSKIEWCDHTFNPWEGCQKVGPGRDNCYAEVRDKRFTGGAHWGPGAPRRRTSSANWRKPIKWNRDAAASGVRPRVFCSSLADVFDNAVDPQWRADLFDLIRATPHLDWLLLTKRPGNIANMLPEDWGNGWPNVWFGCTIVNQEEADRDIPKLLAVRAAVRFLSMEPLLGHVDLTAIKHPKYAEVDALSGYLGTGMYGDYGPKIDWVIVGGESGPNARPMHPDWARSLRDQCAAAGVAFHFKQWGEWAQAESRVCPDSDMSSNKAIWLGWDGTQAKPSHLGLNRPIGVIRIGKARAGRLMDGLTHDGLPTDGKVTA